MSIVYYSRPNGDFSDLYLAVRRKENRIFIDDQVAKLPDPERGNDHFQEWRLRKKSAERFIRYLESKKKRLEILDIGCGNGWFSNLMSQVENTEVTGLEINTAELEQAERVFRKPNLKFVYADIFEKTALNDRKFDLIVFNSCFQYFKNAQQLLEITSGLLSEDGEIHIIDTPFYKNTELENARKRTEDYYTNLGFPEMALHYHHHCWGELPLYKIYYKPSLFIKLLRHDSPFCWIKI